MSSKVAVLCAVEYRLVADGQHASVRMSERAWEAYSVAIDGNDEISVRRKRHFRRNFEEFCGTAMPRLSQEKYKKEGEFPDGYGGTVGVYCFKAWQIRIYGAVLQVGGGKCFVGERVDASKKQDAADQQLLRATALDIGKLAEYGAQGRRRK